MITKFKIYENKLILEPNSCWVIYGNLYKVISILKKITEIDKKHLPDIIKSLESNIWRNKYIHSIGTFIFTHSNPNYSYYMTFNSDEEKKEIMEKHNFKGEIKLVYDKIVLDTFEANVKKYNL
jgi:hypothetical protein